MVDVITTTDIAYTHRGGKDLHLDLHMPVVPAPPLVIYFHGGAFRVGDKTEDSDSRLRALACHGVAVASVNYRLVDEGAFPAALEDARSAIEWARQSADSHGYSPGPLGLWGASAGGYIAASAGLAATREQPSTTSPGAIGAIVSWFAPLDLVANSRRSPLEAAVFSEPVEYALFPKKLVDEADPILAANSPIHQIHSHTPPFLLMHGDRDQMVSSSQSESMHAVLTRSGISSHYLSVGGAGHEDPAFDSPSSLAMTAAFLRAQLVRKG